MTERYRCGSEHDMDERKVYYTVQDYQLPGNPVLYRYESMEKAKSECVRLNKKVSK